MNAELNTCLIYTMDIYEAGEMDNTVKWGLILVYIPLVLFSSGIVSGQSFIFNTQDFPLFSYKIDEKISGPAAKIIKAVFEELYRAHIQTFTMGKTKKEVEGGRTNAMFVIGRNKAREE
jgi:hypothetical protein